MGFLLTIVGIAFVAFLAKEHLNNGGKITVFGVIVIMIFAIGWSAHVHVDKIVACEAGNQQACEQLDAESDR